LLRIYRTGRFLSHDLYYNIFITKTKKLLTERKLNKNLIKT
jgi:hypothetical protein